MSDKLVLDQQRANVRMFLDVSTDNLPEAEAEALDSGDAPCVIYTKHSFGYWVWVWPEKDDDGPIDHDRASKFPGISAVVAVARQLGCCWINFDQDADTLAGLARREG